MRKIVAMLLAGCLLFALSGCKNGEGGDASNASSYDVDVLYYLGIGQIPEVEIKLGDTEDAVQTQYAVESTASEEGDVHEHGDIGIERIEGEKTVKLTNGNLSFFYEKEKADAGISVIASFDTAYGFEVGIALKDDVKNAIGTEATELEATSDQTFFFPVPVEGCQILRYTAGNYQLDFFFTDDFLSATTITDTANWTQA